MPDLSGIRFMNFNFMAILQDLLVATFIFIIGMQLIRILRKIIGKIIESKGLSPGFKYTIDQILRFFLYFLLFIMIVQTMGFQTSALLAVLGSLGLALGLSLQGSLSDIASGILIIVLEPIRHGDFVYLDIKKEEQLQVVEIRLFHTIFVNGNNLTVIVPNSKLVNDRITNISRLGFAFTGVTISIGMNEDVEKARNVIHKVFCENDKIIQTESYFVSIADMSDGRITLNCSAAVAPEYYSGIRGELRESIKSALENSGFSITSPEMGISFRRNAQIEEP